MRNNIWFFLFIPILLLLSGCWDAVEIEERGFLAGIAVDKGKGGEEEYEMTEQFVVPGGLGTASQGGGGGKAYQNVSNTGESLQNIHSSISRQVNKRLNTEHLDFIIISDELVKEEKKLGDILDVFIRQPGMRRGILLAIANGKAKDFLDIKPEQVKVPAQYLSELTENYNSVNTTEPVRLGNIQESMIEKRSFIIPQYKILEEDSVEYEGLALFRGSTNQLVGVLKDPVAKGVQLITGKHLEGSITTEFEEDKFSFLILDGGSKKKLMNKDINNLHFKVSIELDVAVAEYTGSRNLDKAKEVRKFEELINEEIKKRVEETMKIVKEEYQVDVFSFHDYLRMYHYDIWKQVKENWDFGENYFSKSTVTFEVKANLFRPGSTAITE